MNARRTPFAAALLGVAGLATGLVACAQGTSATPAPGLRVRVTTVAEWPDLDAFARRTAQASGTTVRDAAAIAPRGFTVTLICAEPAACDRALAQLAKAADFVTEAVPDRRMTIPRPILPNDNKAR